MSKEEFIEYWCKNAGMSREDFDVYCDIKPCECGGESCLGWVMIMNEEWLLSHMNELVEELNLRTATVPTKPMLQ